MTGPTSGPTSGPKTGQTSGQKTGPAAEPQADEDFAGDRLPGVVHVIASPYKTGSSSMGKALRSLGIGQAEMPHRARLLRPHRHALRAFNAAAQGMTDPDAFLAVHGATARGALHRLLGHLAPFDVFADYPFGHDHMHVFLRLALAPEARFIWIHRDFDAWTDSVRRWEESHPETYPRHHLWQTEAPARRAALKARWEARLSEFRQLAAARPDRCLEVRLESLNDDLGPLLEFYGITATPETRFPRRNVFGGGS